MTAKEGLPKYERICKENDIEVLFKKGEGFTAYPFRVVFRFFRDPIRPVTCRLLVSVSKKRFHHAFKRNRVKRLMREAWRKNKSPLLEMCQQDNISLDVALVYNATLVHSYQEMFDKTKKAVNEIVKRHEKHRQAAG